MSRQFDRQWRRPNRYAQSMESEHRRATYGRRRYVPSLERLESELRPGEAEALVKALGTGVAGEDCPMWARAWGDKRRPRGRELAERIRERDRLRQPEADGSHSSTDDGA